MCTPGVQLALSLLATSLCASSYEIFLGSCLTYLCLICSVLLLLLLLLLLFTIYSRSSPSLQSTSRCTL
jgi:hypothetical protein